MIRFEDGHGEERVMGHTKMRRRLWKSCQRQQRPFSLPCLISTRQQRTTPLHGKIPFGERHHHEPKSEGQVKLKDGERCEEKG